jgi:hypothetical protein
MPCAAERNRDVRSNVARGANDENFHRGMGCTVVRGSAISPCGLARVLLTPEQVLCAFLDAV